MGTRDPDLAGPRKSKNVVACSSCPVSSSITLFRLSTLPQMSQHSPAEMDKPENSFNDDVDEKAVGQPNPDDILETRFADLSRWETVKTFKKTIMFCCLAGFSAVNDGYQMQLPGGIIVNPSFVEVFATTTDASGAPALSSDAISAWGGCLAAANLLGVYVGPFGTERIGHKLCMYIFSVLMLVATAMELAAKIIFGFAMGMIQTVMCTYLSEIAPHQIRGFSIALYQLGFAIGQLISSIALQIVIEKYGSEPMSYMNALYSEFVLHGLWWICMILLPDSPWFLAKRGKHEKAKKALKRLVGNVPGYDLEYEYRVTVHELQTQGHEDEALEKRPSWKEVFTGSNLKRTIASALAMSFQQLVGGAVFFTYFTYFFAQSGLPDPFLATVIIFVLIVAFIGVSWFVIETFGRRRSLLLGAGGLCALNVAIGIVGSFELTSAGEQAALALTCLWMIVYATTSAPIGYVSAVEIATPRLRQKTSTISFGSWQALALVFSFAVPYAIVDLGLQTAYIYAGLTFVSFIGIYFIFPETAQRTNAELDEMYAAGVKPWNMRKHKTTLDLSGMKQHSKRTGAI